MVPESNGQPDILCFSSSDWHGKWGSRQQVMQRLAAQGHRVLYIERLAGLEHLWKYSELRKRRRRNWRVGLRMKAPNLWLLAPPPLLPGRYYLTAIAHFNAFLIRVWLRPYLQQLQLHRPILWLYKPEQVPFIGRFNEQLSVYHCIDEMSVGTSGRKRRTITALEINLLKQAQVIFANSLLTYENKRPFNPHTYHLPSGADVEHFVQATHTTQPPHPDMARIPTPRLVFVGNINEKIDIELLAAVAGARPYWSLVLVGQAYPQATDLRPLQGLANVHWLGKRDFKTLPHLLRGADLCLLPYVQGEATLYRSPLKLYEYLATGKPIVSTPHPEVNHFKEIVAIAAAEDFLSAIEHNLQNDSREAQTRRIAVARQHSWDKRVDEMESVLNKYLP